MPKYYRNFIFLTKYAENAGGASAQGRCVIEAREAETKINVYVQGLRPAAPYKLLLVTNENGANCAVNIGKVVTDEKGKCDTKFSVNTQNVCESGKEIEQFGAAIVGTVENGIIAALLGFKDDKKFSWEQNLYLKKEEIKDIVKDTIKKAATEVKTVIQDAAEVISDAEKTVTDIFETVDDAKKAPEEIKEDLIDGLKKLKEEIAEPIAPPKQPQTIITKEEIAALLSKEAPPLLEEESPPLEKEEEKPEEKTEDIADKTPKIHDTFTEMAKRVKNGLREIQTHSVPANNKLEDMFFKNTKMYPFVKQRADCLWVRGTLEELTSLEYDINYLAKEAFIIDRYMQYKHIIFGKLRINPIDSDAKYVLGIPDVFGENREKAEQLGLTQFKTCLDKLEPGAHGYWLVTV